MSDWPLSLPSIIFLKSSPFLLASSIAFPSARYDWPAPVVLLTRLWLIGPLHPSTESPTAGGSRPAAPPAPPAGSPPAPTPRARRCARVARGRAARATRRGSGRGPRRRGSGLAGRARRSPPGDRRCGTPSLRAWLACCGPARRRGHGPRDEPQRARPVRVRVASLGVEGRGRVEVAESRRLVAAPQP